MPPDFHARAYWDARFGAGGEPVGGHEWLGLPETFTSACRTWLEALADSGSGRRADARRHALQSMEGGSELPPPPPPDVLHIGSGSSQLSFDLRRWLPTDCPPDCILNVDFSPAAVAAGSQQESEQFGEPTDGASSMRWATLDLLDSTDVVALVRPATERPHRPLLILDKSTSDALSCGPALQSPFDRTGPAIHPLALLGRNLALVAPEGSTWLVHSYSHDRFGGIDLGDGLWVRTRKELIDVPDLDKEGQPILGRPCVQHSTELWVRTAREVPTISI
jgi:hypothetical protein